MLDTIEVGLGDSQLLNTADFAMGMLRNGTEGEWQGTEAGIGRGGSGSIVGVTILLVIRGSSILIRTGADETCSYDLSFGPPSAATMSASDTPRSKSSERSLLFSSRTFLAAVWISADASIPA